MTLEIIFSILLLVVMALAVLPTVPSIPLMFLVVLGYGVIDGFETLQPGRLAIFGAMAVASLVIDYSAGLIGAKLGGASKRSLVYGLIGLVIGLITFPPLGALLGLFAGVFIGESLRLKDHAQALRAASYSIATAAAGVLANGILAVTFFVLFLVTVF